jgi:hypothetical protein
LAPPCFARFARARPHPRIDALIEELEGYGVPAPADKETAAILTRRHAARDLRGQTR